MGGQGGNIQVVGISKTHFSIATTAPKIDRPIRGDGHAVFGAYRNMDNGFTTQVGGNRGWNTPVGKVAKTQLTIIIASKSVDRAIIGQ